MFQPRMFIKSQKRINLELTSVKQNVLTVTVINLELRVVVLVERYDRGGIQLASQSLICRFIAAKSKFGA